MRDQTDILYVIPRPEIGGAEKQLLRLIEHLDTRRYRATVICLDGGGSLLAAFKKTAAEVIVLRRRGLFDLGTFVELIRHIRRIQPTTVHTTLYIANLFGGWAARLAGVPRVVVSQRGLGIDPRHSTLKRVSHAIFNGFIAMFADIRTVNSHAIADRMADYGWEDCQVIYNGILDQSAPDDGTLNALGEELELPKGSTILTAVSRVDPKKDLVTMLTAFRQILNRHSDTYLLIAGGGDSDYRQHLIELAHRLDIIGHVRFLGFRNDVTDLVALGDISVLSSITEGLPNAVLESMLMARPVVATAVGGIPELIEDGVEGYLVPSDNAAALADRVVDLIQNPVRRESMGLFGRTRALSAFNVQTTVDRTTSTYLSRPRDHDDHKAYAIRRVDLTSPKWSTSTSTKWARSA